MRPAPLALLAALALPGTALGATREVRLELGSIAAPDPDWNLFSDADRLSTQGLGVGWTFHDHLALVAGWRRGAHGMTVGGESTGQSDLTATFGGHLFSLGAKADWTIAPWFAPFATARAAGLLGIVRLDDEPDDDENLNQITHAAFAPGALATAGAEFRLPFHDGAFAAATSLELGYAWLAPLSYDPLGDLAFRGFTLTWGAGVRF